MKPTNLPKDGSYVFEGIVASNPVKTVYFANKDKVYIAGLSQNCSQRGRYTADADKVFQNMLQSIKFL